MSASDFVNLWASCKKCEHPRSFWQDDNGFFLCRTCGEKLDVELSTRILVDSLNLLNYGKPTGHVQTYLQVVNERTERLKEIVKDLDFTKTLRSESPTCCNGGYTELGFEHEDDCKYAKAMINLQVIIEELRKGHV